MNARRVLISFLLLMTICTVTYGGSWVTATAKTSTGSLDYKVWVPADYRKTKPAPLVLMLHGCLQGPEDLAALSQMNSLADKETFLVVYPQQTAAANALRCWNWFDPKHQDRGAGEPSLIAAAINDVRASYRVREQQIYVVGISAGGAMAVLMAAAYPEIFAAVGVIAAPEYKAASTVQGGLAAMKNGGPDPTQQGLAAYQAMQKSGARKKKRIPLMDIQGTKDPYVNPINSDQLVAQWVQTNDLLDDGKDNDSITKSPVTAEGAVPNGYSYTKYSYRDRKGHVVVEKLVVNGLGHAWSGSTTANQFADAKGPDATMEIWRFFRATTAK